MCWWHHVSQGHGKSSTHDHTYICMCVCVCLRTIPVTVEVTKASTTSAQPWRAHWRVALVGFPAFHLEKVGFWIKWKCNYLYSPNPKKWIPSKFLGDLWKWKAALTHLRTAASWWQEAASPHQATCSDSILFLWSHHECTPEKIGWYKSSLTD